MPQPVRDRVEITFTAECELQPGCISEIGPTGLIELVECEAFDLIDLTETEVVEIAFRP